MDLGCCLALSSPFLVCVKFWDELRIICGVGTITKDHVVDGLGTVWTSLERAVKVQEFVVCLYQTR